MKIKFWCTTRVSETGFVKICVLLMCIASILQDSMIFQSWNILINACKYMIPMLGILVFIIKAMRVASFKSFLLICIVCATIIVTCIQSGDYSYLLVCIILILSQRLKINDFVNISYRTLIIGGGLHILLWLINCVINLGYPVFYNVSEGRISFLFTHPNIAAIKLGWGVVMYIWLQWEKLTKKKLLACFFAVLVVHYSTKADSCIILMGYILLVAFRNIGIVRKATVFFSKYSFFLFGALSFGFSLIYMGSGKLMQWARILDVFFNRRLAMAYLAIQDNGITLFGQSITRQHEWSEIFNFGNYTVDSLYVYFFVSIGLFWFLVISAGFYRIGRYRDYKASLIVLIFSLYALIEVHCLYLSNCFALLLLKCVLFREKKIE